MLITDKVREGFIINDESEKPEERGRGGVEEGRMRRILLS
jgi:hypothetical protein